MTRIGHGTSETTGADGDARPARGGRAGTDPRWADERADEVERLRAENERLRRQLAATRVLRAWNGLGREPDRSSTSKGAEDNGTEDKEIEGSRGDADDPAAHLALLESMLETVPVGVVLADANGRIVHGNAWVERMLKHPVLHSADTEAYGEWVSFHADGQRVESHEYPLSRVIRDGEEHAQLDVHYRRGDGTMFWMRVIGEPVRDAGGDRVGATVALVDIDEEVRLKAQQDALIGELDHRVRNAFSVARSVTSMSLRGHGVPMEARREIEERLSAYAAANASLVGRGWERASLRELCDEAVGRIGGERIAMSGPEIELPARDALAIAMALYELGTNASKHGALSVPEGRVTLEWRLASPDEAGGRDGRTRLHLLWTERGGPPPQSEPSSGFGTVITGKALENATKGTVDRDLAEEGMIWHFAMPLDGH